MREEERNNHSSRRREDRGRARSVHRRHRSDDGVDARRERGERMHHRHPSQPEKSAEQTDPPQHRRLIRPPLFHLSRRSHSCVCPQLLPLAAENSPCQHTHPAYIQKGKSRSQSHSHSLDPPASVMSQSPLDSHTPSHPSYHSLSAKRTRQLRRQKGKKEEHQPGRHERGYAEEREVA
jgi:hypothetical protein